MATIETAQASTITIGDQVLNCYLLTDGSYRFSQRGLAGLMKKDESQSRRFLAKNGYKSTAIKVSESAKLHPFGRGGSGAILFG